MKNRYPLYLLSDSSGNLLEHFLGAILTQFPKEKFDVQTLSFLKDEEKLRKALESIREGIVFHGLISPRLKALAASECVKRKLPCWDVTGPTADFLQKVTDVPPSLTPKPLHSFDINYQKRVDALEFSMQHDDSRRLEDLEKADIILVGISRVSKSPNALFLAYRGFRVANVSIIPSQELPERLVRHVRKNVAALTLQPVQLAEIRKRRFSQWKLNQFEYEDLPKIIDEVSEAEKIYREKGWPVIDTTGLAIEETSALILSALNLRPKVFE